MSSPANWKENYIFSNHRLFVSDIKILVNISRLLLGMHKIIQRQLLSVKPVRCCAACLCPVCFNTSLSKKEP